VAAASLVMLMLMSAEACKSLVGKAMKRPIEFCAAGRRVCQGTPVMSSDR
jgi:hypothetical protein